MKARCFVLLFLAFCRSFAEEDVVAALKALASRDVLEQASAEAALVRMNTRNLDRCRQSLWMAHDPHLCDRLRRVIAILEMRARLEQLPRTWREQWFILEEGGHVSGHLRQTATFREDEGCVDLSFAMSSREQSTTLDLGFEAESTCALDPALTFRAGRARSTVNEVTIAITDIVLETEKSPGDSLLPLVPDFHLLRLVEITAFMRSQAAQYRLRVLAFGSREEIVIYTIDDFGIDSNASEELSGCRRLVGSGRSADGDDEFWVHDSRGVVLARLSGAADRSEEMTLRRCAAKPELPDPDLSIQLPDVLDGEEEEFKKLFR